MRDNACTLLYAKKKESMPVSFFSLSENSMLLWIIWKWLTCRVFSFYASGIQFDHIFFHLFSDDDGGFLEFYYVRRNYAFFKFLNCLFLLCEVLQMDVRLFGGAYCLDMFMYLKKWLYKQRKVAVEWWMGCLVTFTWMRELFLPNFLSTAEMTLLKKWSNLCIIIICSCLWPFF